VSGLRANFLGLTGILFSCLVSLVIMKVMGLSLEHALGLFAGSNTSTPALQAALATFGNDDPAIGYSVAYPFGVAGPILCLYLAFAILKPKIRTAGGLAHGTARGRADAAGILRQARRRVDDGAAASGPDRRAASW
jgi:putative transport protein